MDHFKHTSLHSKSNLNAHNFNRADSSDIDDKVNKNCSALPSGSSGLINWASCIFPRSSSVGSMFSNLSIPSRVTTVASIFNIAALMARGGGNLVIAILIALDRL